MSEKGTTKALSICAALVLLAGCSKNPYDPFYVCRAERDRLHDWRHQVFMAEGENKTEATHLRDQAERDYFKCARGVK